MSMGSHSIVWREGDQGEVKLVDLTTSSMTMKTGSWMAWLEEAQNVIHVCIFSEHALEGSIIPIVCVGSGCSLYIGHDCNVLLSYLCQSMAESRVMNEQTVEPADLPF